MKKIIFLFFIAVSVLSAQNTYIITTKNNQTFKGRISNQDNIIEWRKDIYKITKPDGTAEQFILSPHKTGRLSLQQIASIEFVPEPYAPVRYISLSNSIKAKQVLQYRIQLKNKNIFYISDFITLSHYYITVSSPNLRKKIYLTTIKKLQLESSSADKTPVSYQSRKTAPAVKTISPRSIQKKQTAPIRSVRKTAKPQQDKKSVLFLLIILLLSLILILSGLLIYLYIKFKSTSGKKKTKKIRKKKKPLKSSKKKKRKKYFK